MIIDKYSQEEKEFLLPKEEIAIRIYVTARYLGVKTEVVWNNYLSEEVKKRYKKKEILSLINEIMK